jgi:hypothetical protein
MANQEHLDILKQGVKAWNEWRVENGDVLIDLNEADLSYSDLSYANFRGATLIHANLSYANFTTANFYTANLNGANLSDANLNGVNLSDANLDDTDLSGARLISANLSRTILHRTNLIGTRIGLTIFGDLDLQTVIGLETVDHSAPSTIGTDTIYRSHGNIPEVFLKGAGLDDTFITYIRSLAGKPIDYYSCFISYSSKDDAFAKRLYADLQNNNVRCWFAPEDLKWGERIRSGIDEAIRLHDKLLLILSKSSVASGWVEREVKTALAKECKEKRTVLFPVRVDDAIFECPFDWATEIRHERNIGDFTRWTNYDDYQKAFNRLLRDLKAEAMTD